MSAKSFTQSVRHILGERKWQVLSTSEKRTIRELDQIQRQSSKDLKKDEKIVEHSSDR